MPIFELHPTIHTFPDPALAEPGMPLAIGGDLSTARLVEAYSNGIFPWYSEGEPLMWWSPDPRMVLFPSEVVVHKSMRAVLRNKGFSFTINRHFSDVIRACSKVSRPGQAGTWITSEMIAAYEKLHHEGWAHSLEVWQNGELVGGLYGIALRKVFAGESMYSTVSNASKVALIALSHALIKMDYRLIDCQVYSAHLASMGARETPRSDYLGIIKKSPVQKDRGWWKDFGEIPAWELV